MAFGLRGNSVKKLAVFGVLNFITTVLLLIWSNSSNSMALTAFAYLTIFDMLSLATCFVSIWVKSQTPTRAFSFGYQRFEVLAVFSSTLLAQLGSLFILKESVERLVQQPDVHESRLLPGTGLAFFVHMLITYSVENQALSHVVLASSSSWLQEHVSDISESVCSILPGMSKLLLPRINPFALIGSASAASLVLTYFLIDLRNFHAADTWAAVWIAVMTIGTLSPMSAYTGKILLQTTPAHIISQLDKCIREASTLDGVLEFRQEHFWTLSFGNMSGSVHVRIRRDADEQMVLAHVFNRLSNLVTILTVHVFKDDWNRPQSYHLLNDNSFLNRGGVSVGVASTGNVGNSSPPLASPVGGAYNVNTPQQGHYDKPYVPIGAAASNTFVAPSLGVPQQNGTRPPGGGGGYAARTPASFKVGNLNPDIMNLLGSTTSNVAPPSSGGNVKLDMNHVGPTQSYPVPNQMAGLSHNHMTYSNSTRTDPDGASKSQ